MFESMDLKLWIAPGIFIGGGMLLGLVAEKIILPLIRKASQKIQIEAVTLTARSIRGMVFSGGIHRSADFHAAEA